MTVFEDRYGHGSYERLMGMFDRPCMTFAEDAPAMEPRLVLEDRGASGRRHSEERQPNDPILPESAPDRSHRNPSLPRPRQPQEVDAGRGRISLASPLGFAGSMKRVQRPVPGAPADGEARNASGRDDAKWYG
jgi:hypothetical protein